MGAVSSRVFEIGETVVLRVAPGKFARLVGRRGVVKGVTADHKLTVADVTFPAADGQPGETVADIPTAYLAHAPATGPVEPPEKAARRPAFYLHEPTDDRSEEEKQDAAVCVLRGWGYVVLEYGQHKSQAVCWKCTQIARAASKDAKLVKVFCKHGHGPVYSPDYGNTDGAPDLGVSHPTHWAPPGDYRPVMLVEFKQSETSERKPAQVRFAGQGISVIAWSTAMLVKAVFDFEKRWIPAGPNPDVYEWLEKRGLLTPPEDTNNG